MSAQRYRMLLWTSSLSLFLACSDSDDAEVTACEPENACQCTDGTERDTACVCVGGSTCSIEGNSIEFSCQGNAACGLSCGTDCLITCPGTTMCTVATGDDAVVECPGTASCDVTCHGDCTVNVAGAAKAVLRCTEENASCELAGCSATDCGNGIWACKTACPD